MLLTKHVHACVTLESKGRTLLIDPGVFEPRTPDLLAEADAVLVTHAHADHFHAAAFEAELARRPSLPVVGLASVVGDLAQIGTSVRVVEPGMRLEVAGFGIEVLGGSHQEIYPQEPIAPNVGYLIDDRVYHPGDSYTVPDVAVSTLLVPVSGPWTRFADAAAFVSAVSPRRAIAIHEAALSEIGLRMLDSHLGEGGRLAVPLERLAGGETMQA